MSSQSIPLVPFGKYKGKPVTDLIADTSYVDWCKKQDWFEKYPSVYNIVVHQTFQTNTNSKTPEHNKIQNMFLKDDFQNAVLSHLHELSHDVITNLLNEIYSNEGYIKYFGNQTIDASKFNYANSKKKIEFEAMYNWDVILECNLSSPHIKSLIDADNYEYGKLNFPPLVGLSTSCYGKNPIDLQLMNYTKLFIEIKPILSDDYPCVLRKMKLQIDLTNKKYKETMWSRHYILLIDKFSSDSASIDDIKNIFKQANIRVILLHELSKYKKDEKYVTILEEEYLALKEKVKEYETLLKISL